MNNVYLLTEDSATRNEASLYHLIVRMFSHLRVSLVNTRLQEQYLKSIKCCLFFIKSATDLLNDKSRQG